MKLKTRRQKVSTAIAYTLTTFAFVSSYLHGVSWAQKHSKEDGGAQLFAWGYAAIPELILIAVLSYGKFDRKALIGAAMSVSWTMWVNGASAAPGASGMVVALVAPVAALYCAWLTDGGSEPEEAQAQDETTAQSPAQLEPELPVAQPEPELSPVPELEPEPLEPELPVAQPVAEPELELPVAPAHAVIEPEAAQSVTRLKPRPVAQKPKAQRGAFAEGVKWLTAKVAEGEWTKEKKAQELATELGVSLATAKRIRTEVFGPVRAQKADKTDETDQRESA